MDNIFNNNLIIDIVLRFFYPTRCACCEKILKEIEIKSGFCKQCRAIIKPTNNNKCLKCGKILSDISKEYCKDCERKNHEFIQGKSVYSYSGPMKDAMYKFKYSNRRYLAKVFAKDAYVSHRRWLDTIKPDIIVAVPMYNRKKKRRGYNQAELFGEALSYMIKVPIVKELVVRKKNTKPLKTLSSKERASSLKNAFECTKRFQRPVDILIVDDILTTGATVDEVARTLKKAGAGRIYCMFICAGIEK